MSLSLRDVALGKLELRIVPDSVADSDPDPPDPHVFGPPGSESGSICQRHGSADLDPHQNVMDPQHWFRMHVSVRMVFGDWRFRILKSQVASKKKLLLSSDTIE